MYQICNELTISVFYSTEGKPYISLPKAKKLKAVRSGNTDNTQYEYLITQCVK